jgi:hypothetical protein
MHIFRTVMTAAAALLPLRHINLRWHFKITFTLGIGDSTAQAENHER